MNEKINNSNLSTSADMNASSTSLKTNNNENDIKLLRATARILIIDDSEFSRKSIAQVLERNGFNVIGTAESANTAIEIMKQQEANIFIIDLIMPDISGMEFAKTIIEKYTKSVVIMISSLPHEHIVLEAISIGVIDFLHKPISESNLINSLERSCLTMIEENKI
jgi:two-component system chemotaxis response regulator CheY